MKKNLSAIKKPKQIKPKNQNQTCLWHGDQVESLAPAVNTHEKYSIENNLIIMKFFFFLYNFISKSASSIKNLFSYCAAPGGSLYNNIY